MKIAPRKPADIVLVVLLATDVLLIVGYILYLTTTWVYDSNYSIVEERGFGETFQYLKAFWLVLFFGWLALITRERSYLSWGALFGYLGLDDMMEIHEELGNTLATRLDLPEMLGQRPRDIGEILVLGAVGCILLVALAISWWRGSETFRERSAVLLRLTMLLVFFGIVLDAVHILFLETTLDYVFGILEDGGEMVMLSVTCWYVFKQLVPEPAIAQPVPQLVATNGREATPTERLARR